MNLHDFNVRFGYGKPSGANFAHIPVEVGTAGGGILIITKRGTNNMQVINKKIEEQKNHMMYGMIGTLLIVTLLSGLSLCLGNVLATAGTASGSNASRASVGVAQSCSMTATINTEHTAVLTNGTYSSTLYPDGIGLTTIETFCNDPSGYSIYAVGYSDDTVGNTYLRDTDLGSDYDIATGTAETGTVSNWAMKVAGVSRTISGKDLTPETKNGYGSFSVVPTSYTEVARYGSTTGVVVGEGSALTTTYAAYISGTQPAGTYEGQVKYTLVHPGGSDVPTVDTMQNVAQWGGNVLVGETVTATDSRDNNTYKVARVCTNYSGENCTASELWMTENLDLALSPDNPLTSQNTDLTEYKDSQGRIYPGYTCSNEDPNCTSGTITWTPGSTLATPATISNFDYSSSATTVVSGWTNDSYQPHWAEGRLNGLSTNEVYTKDYKDVTYTSLNDCLNAGNTPDQCAHWHIGNYYNWSAAVATNNTTNYNTQYTTMPNSICPAGWHLPKGLTGTDTSDDSNLSDFNTVLYANGMTGDGGNPAGKDFVGGVNVKYSATGWNKMKGDPFYFVRSGRVNGTTLYNASNHGSYWSSTMATSGSAYPLSFNSGVLYPSSVSDRNYGFSVRCVTD